MTELRAKPVTNRNFTDTKLWQSAHSLCLKIYETSSNFPMSESLGLTAQIRRASVSVSSNIAEGYGRATTKDQEHFYQLASGSMHQLKNHLHIAAGLNYITHQEHSDISELADQTHKLLNGAIGSQRSYNETTRAGINYLTSNI